MLRMNCDVKITWKSSFFMFFKSRHNLYATIKIFRISIGCINYVISLLSRLYLFGIFLTMLLLGLGLHWLPWPWLGLHQLESTWIDLNKPFLTFSHLFSPFTYFFDILLPLASCLLPLACFLAFFDVMWFVWFWLVWFVWFWLSDFGHALALALAFALLGLGLSFCFWIWL